MPVQQQPSLMRSALDKVMSIKPGSIGRAYQNTLGNRPALESLVLGGLGGYAAYKATPLLARKVLGMFMPGASQAQIDEAYRQAEADGRVKDIAKFMGLGAGALGAAYPVFKSVNFTSGPRAAVNSFLGGKFYDKEGPDAKYDQAINRKRTLDAAERARDPLTQKVGSFQDPLVGTNIPISYSMDLLQGDPFLREPEKVIASSLLEGADGSKSGVTDGSSIVRSAVRAGVGFVPAYAFGKVMTNLAQIPEPAAKNMSLAGGVASAIYNTGILQEFLSK